MQPRQAKLSAVCAPAPHTSLNTPLACRMLPLPPHNQAFAALRALPEQAYLEACSSSSVTDGIVIDVTSSFRSGVCTRVCVPTLRRTGVQCAACRSHALCTRTLSSLFLHRIRTNAAPALTLPPHYMDPAPCPLCPQCCPHAPLSPQPAGAHRQGAVAAAPAWPRHPTEHIQLQARGWC